MRKNDSLVGLQFGRFHVLQFDSKDKRGESLYRCLCQCGKYKIVRGSRLTSGNTTSCGCYKKELFAAKKGNLHRTHFILNEPTACSKCGEIYPWGPEFFTRQGRAKGYPFGCSQPCKKCSYRQRAAWRTEAKKTGTLPKPKKRIPTEESRKKQCVIRTRWRKANPWSGRLHNHRRRAMEREAMGTLTRTDIDLQYEGQKGRCWWCKGKLNGKYHMDHRIALAIGGKHDRSNIVLACAKCNQRKNIQLPQEWAGRLL